MLSFNSGRQQPSPVNGPHSRSPSVFFIGIETLADVNAANARFGGTGRWTVSDFSTKVLRFEYDWAQYVALAKHLGFSL